MTYLFKIETKVSGIPCEIGVFSYEPFFKGNLTGTPEQCYPDDGGIFDWEVLDLSGRPALWLEDKLTDIERDRIDLLLSEKFRNESI